jgi:hypothetical protein
MTAISIFGQMLLERQIAVDSYKDTELILCQNQQLAVGNSRPSLRDDCVNFESMDMVGKLTIHTFVERTSSGFVDRQRRGAHRAQLVPL